MYSKDLLRLMYERMVLIRTFEERFRSLVEAGRPLGSGHLYAGQEAVAVGACVNLTDQDWIASTHRGHGHCIAKGVDPRMMMAELYGKITSSNKGKGGSMHITDMSKGMLGVNPIVGGGIPHAVGAALSARVLGNDTVGVAFFGDGASNQGTFHESINLAAVWNLPCIFICENNGYAESTPVEYSVRAASIAERATGYGIPGVSVDGQDVFAVYEAVKEAVERARSGGGPTLIEAKTYRYYGHFLGDNPLRYRSKEEEDYHHDRDCLKRFREQVGQDGSFSVAELDDIDAKAQELLEEAVRFAEEAPMPTADDLYTDVYGSYPTSQLRV